jgi:thymidylate kinase
MSQGLHISLLGVDGIGKSTLASLLAQRLREHGIPVRLITWRRTLDDAEAQISWPQVALQQMWVETFRLLYGGATSGGKSLLLPRDYPTWRDEGHEARLAASDVSGARYSGPLAAALVELAGNTVLFPEVIHPAVERGEVVIQETFPYKHVLKQLLVANRIGQDHAHSQLTEHVMSFMATTFGSGLFQPDIGVLIDGPVSLAYSWRMAESGHVGVLEDYGAAGERGESGFHALQEQTADAFRRVAKDWKWLVHTVDDTGLENNMRRGLDLVMAHPELVSLLAGRRAGRH